MNDQPIEFECRVPVSGYRVLTFDERKFLDAEVDTDAGTVSPPADATEDELYLLSRWGSRLVPWASDPEWCEGFFEVTGNFWEPEVRQILEPQSKKIRRFDLFKKTSSPWIEFANRPATPLFEAEGPKALANKFGPLLNSPLYDQGPEYVDQWHACISELHRAAKAWEKAKETGDFGSIIRLVSFTTSISKQFGSWRDRKIGRIDANVFLREDPISGEPRLRLRPTTLSNALWTQLAQAIAGHESLGACSVCKRWFAMKTRQGRYDKEFCSNACKQRAFRAREAEKRHKRA